MMCILNHHAAHIYLCGDVRRTVHRQNIWNLCGQIYVLLSRTTEKYLEFMQTEICSIIRDYRKNIWNLCGYVTLSRKFPSLVNLCLACVIKILPGQYRHKPWIFFYKISISCELCSAFVIIIKAHKGNVVTGHGFF